MEIQVHEPQVILQRGALGEGYGKMLPLYILCPCESAAKHLMLGLGLLLVSKVSSLEEELNTKQKRIRTIQTSLGISASILHPICLQRP